MPGPTNRRVILVKALLLCCGLLLGSMFIVSWITEATASECGCEEHSDLVGGE